MTMILYVEGMEKSRSPHDHIVARKPSPPIYPFPDRSMAAQGLLFDGSLNLQESPLSTYEHILCMGCWGLRRLKSQLREAV